jgi:hypothetical protein
LPPLCQERDKPWNWFGRLSGAGGVHKKYAACSKGGFAAACGADENFLLHTRFFCAIICLISELL